MSNNNYMSCIHIYEFPSIGFPRVVSDEIAIMHSSKNEVFGYKMKNICMQMK
jgi:hypothetical protein